MTKGAREVVCPVQLRKCTTSIANRKDREPSIGFEYLYDQRSDKTIDGMMPREAFEILKGEHRVEVFARIGSLDALKKSVLTNGAALIAMNVFSYNDDFWNGDEFMGGHAVAVVGYDETGLIIKNSWGTSFGRGGYTTLPYSQFNKVREAWTLLS